MKRRHAWLFSLILLGALPTGCSVGQVSAPSAPSGPYQVVNVTASDWKWVLSSKHLRYGEPVKFVVKSIQGTHGFSIVGTNVSNAVTVGGKPQVVYCNPPAKGTYTIACNVYCGAGHSSMVTSFMVS